MKRAWSVRLWTPVENSKYGTCKHRTVIAETLERACVVVRAKYPDCKIWNVVHIGKEPMWDDSAEGAMVDQS